MNRILHAANFAADKHSRQRRKNPEATPYINHPIEVADHLARVGGITDEDILIAALLHDTIEDTQTTKAELADIFGARVAEIVAECSDDKRLGQSERKRLQIVNARHKSPEAKCLKIADKTCNLASILVAPPSGWSIQRQIDYFDWAEQVVAGLIGINNRLDRSAKDTLERGRKTFESAAKCDADGTADVTVPIP